MKNEFRHGGSPASSLQLTSLQPVVPLSAFEKCSSKGTRGPSAPLPQNQRLPGLFFMQFKDSLHLEVDFFASPAKPYFPPLPWGFQGPHRDSCCIGCPFLLSSSKGSGILLASSARAPTPLSYVQRMYFGQTPYVWSLKKVVQSSSLGLFCGRAGANKIMLKEHSADVTLEQLRGRQGEEREVTAGWCGWRGLRGSRTHPVLREGVGSIRDGRQVRAPVVPSQGMMVVPLS